MIADRPAPRVAFVIEKYLPFIGGAERQAALLAELLGPRLGRCDVFTAQPDARSDAAAVTLHRLGTVRHVSWRHPSNFLAAFRRLLTDGHRYSVVHGHALSALSCGAVLGAALRGTATLLKVCSAGPDGDIAKIRRYPLGSRLWPAIRRVGAFVVPVPALVPELLAAGVPADRIAVIPNALSPAMVRPVADVSPAAARAALGLPDRPTVLFVGRLSREKGPDVLMRAWDALGAACDATLVIVGDGAEAERVARWARDPGRAGRVHVAGARLDVERFYRAADVLVVPSRSETFCNVLAEGMAQGLAVVTTPVGLAGQWIRDRQNGIIVGGEDAGAMAAGIRQLLRDAALRERFGAAARRDAVAAFSAESIAEQYVALYARLAAKSMLPVTA